MLPMNSQSRFTPYLRSSGRSGSTISLMSSSDMDSSASRSSAGIGSGNAPHDCEKTSQTYARRARAAAGLKPSSPAKDRVAKLAT